MRKVMIDPGHGGSDPGAVNGNYREADLALEISSLLAASLASSGYDVKMTRSSRTESRPSNTARCRMANEWGADIFVSVHLNSSESDGAHGREVIYCPTSGKGQSLARSINAAFMDSPFHDRGIKTDQDLGRGFKLTVLWKTRMPAVIVEVCFISNPSDLDLILDPARQSEAARMIATGIKAHFKSMDSLRKEGY